jgi:glycine cleavage system H protein
MKIIFRLEKSALRYFFRPASLVVIAAACLSSACAVGSTAADPTTPVSTTTNIPLTTLPTELTLAWPSPAGTHPPQLIFRTDRLYAETHLWIKQESEDTVRIGITYYGQLGLGKLDDLGMPKTGTVMSIDKSFDCFFVGDDCMIFDFPAPVSGTVIEMNELIERDRRVINISPYDDAWLVVVKMDNPAELADLLTYEEYFQSSCPPCHCNN